MLQQHYLSISQQAKYTTLGELNDNTKHIWFVLHGYGQLARFFIRKFSILEENGHYIIAPEATSKFYLKEHSGRVGATWMTKEDRLVDIENYVSYLDTLYDSLRLSKDVEVNVAGFSQGAATASRWLANGHITANRLLLWSSIFPPDLDIVNAQTALSNTKVYNIYGSGDPFLTQEKINEQNSIISELKIGINNIRFEGGHDIDSNILKRFV